MANIRKKFKGVPHDSLNSLLEVVLNANFRWQFGWISKEKVRILDPPVN
jgi:hypothetical protein